MTEETNGTSLENLVASLVAEEKEVAEADLRKVEELLAAIGATDLPEVAVAETVTEEAQAQDQTGNKDIAREAERLGEDVRTLIGKANLPQKIKLAMFGNSTCRGLLVRDGNKMIQEFVLKNPRIQLKEIEEFAKNPQMSQHVLRRVQDNQTWMRSYALKLNLVSNPKTPGDVALKWLKFLTMADLKRLAKSKNVPQVVSVMAKKRVTEAEQR